MQGDSERGNIAFTVKPLPPDDARHLQTAEGWLELGNHIEANTCLEQIAPELRAHPEVLELERVQGVIIAALPHLRRCQEMG